jgi:hypothetical protein
MQSERTAAKTYLKRVSTKLALQAARPTFPAKAGAKLPAGQSGALAPAGSARLCLSRRAVGSPARRDQ